jgi:predicted DNA-binding protein
MKARASIASGSVPVRKNLQPPRYSKIVKLSPDRKPRKLSSSIRMDARLDQPTQRKADDLARHFHRPRAAVLRSIMQWGLSRERPAPINQGESQGPVHHLYCSVAADLYEHVAKAAAAASVKTAQWLRQMVRQITITEFPAIWQRARSEGRSHDSPTSGKRLTMRLEDPTREKLAGLSIHFDKPAAEIIRHLIIHATPEDFPKSWEMRANARSIRWSGR